MTTRSTVRTFASLACGMLALGIASATFAGGNPTKRDAAGGLASITCSCPGDLNFDNIVNAADLSVMLGAWGTNDPTADIDSDGTVNAADLSLLLGAWGACAAPVNDTCGNSIPLVIGENPFCTTGATTTPNFSLSDCGIATTMYNDVWFDYTPIGDGTLTLATCADAEFDTVIAAYTSIIPGLGGCPAADGQIGTVVLAGCNDDFSGCTLNTSKLVLDVQGGSSYKIRVGGYLASSRGSGVLTASFKSVGSACYDAIPTAYGQSHNEVYGTTLDNPFGAPAECGAAPQAARSEWISWVCPCNAAHVTVTTCNNGTDFDTVVEVWREGLDGCQSFLKGCDDDSGCGTTSLVDFYASFDDIILIRVTGYFANSAGNYNIAIDSECIN